MNAMIQDWKNLSSILKNLAEGHIDPKERGKQLEPFLTEVFLLSGLEAYGPFKTSEEQIDGVVRFDGITYLVEAKWTKRKASGSILARLSDRLRLRPEGTRGILVSISGFTRNSVDYFLKISRPNVILIDGNELKMVVERDVSLSSLLSEKIRALELEGKPYRRLTANQTQKPLLYSEQIIDALKKHQDTEVHNVLRFYTGTHGYTLKDLYTLPIKFADWRSSILRETLVGQYTVDDVLLGKEPGKLVILGPPGCGKTTTIRRIALRYGGAQGGKVPITFLISTRSPTNRDEYVKAISDNLVLSIQETKELLVAGQFVLLFDALNEASNLQPHVSFAIQELAEVFPSCSYVVTCRTYSYKQHLRDFRAVEIAPLDDRDIQDFVYIELPQRGIDLFRRIQSTPVLRSLCTNHFMLNAIVKLSQKGSLPIGEAELYARLVRRYLSWNTKRNEKPDVLQKELLLRHFAFRMHEQSCASRIQRLSAELIIDEVVERLALDSSGHPLIERMLIDGILLQEAGNVRFLHDTIREYLVALECVERHLNLKPKRRLPDWHHICHLADEIQQQLT